MNALKDLQTGCASHGASPSLRCSTSASCDFISCYPEPREVWYGARAKSSKIVVRRNLVARAARCHCSSVVLHTSPNRFAVMTIRLRLFDFWHCGSGRVFGWWTGPLTVVPLRTLTGHYCTLHAQGTEVEVLLVFQGLLRACLVSPYF